MYLTLDKKKIQETLTIKLEEYEQKIVVLNLLAKVTDKVKHHKKVTKKLETEAKNHNLSAWLSQGFSQRVTIMINKRIARTSKPDTNGVCQSTYYESAEEVIYFDDYAELLANTQKRIAAIMESISKLTAELASIDAWLSELEDIETEWHRIDNTLSGTFRNAVSFK